MQKLVVARELGMDPKLLIAAQPTRGVDIGAIEAIHQRIVAARDRGAAVLLVSAELSEVLALSDRVAVLYEGRVTGVFEAGAVSEEELGLYMLGIKHTGEPAA
jgi:simple sugar transport system ATP-binding protein